MDLANTAWAYTQLGIVRGNLFQAIDSHAEDRYDEFSEAVSAVSFVLLYLSFCFVCHE